MSNIVKELGVDYFRDRFNEAMFSHEGKAHYISRDIDWARSVGAAVLTGEPQKVNLEYTRVPLETFKDFSVFKTPPLGWRMAAQGRFLCYFGRNSIRRNQYRRGIVARQLRRWYAPSTTFLIQSNNLSDGYYHGTHVCSYLIMNPEYVPFWKGIEAMKQGELYSFCASPNVAVVPEVKEAQGILFNCSKVGTVTKEGEIKWNAPIMEQVLRDVVNGN